MKKIIFIFILIFFFGGVSFFVKYKTAEAPKDETVKEDAKNDEEKREDVQVILNNLEIPWDIAFLPNSDGFVGEMLVAERPGRIQLVSKDFKTREIAVEGVKHAGEGGLLGMVLHPNFVQNKFIYLYISSGYSSTQTRNRVERYKFENDKLIDKKIIIENIPGALYHDGGRMEFHDGYLFITTGDATQKKIAQDKKSLGGKILRLNDDGSIPEDNPFKSAVWSYGHRNPQGLAWDASGRLWETEHGPTGEAGQCCHDELNLITKGGNYEWPDRIDGGVLNSGTDTWAPASLIFLPAQAGYNGSLFFGGLKSETLYEAVLEGDKVKELKTHLVGQFGRIRTIRVGPDGMFYLTTSNRDNRGKPSLGDDKIIRVNPASLK